MPINHSLSNGNDRAIAVYWRKVETINGERDEFTIEEFRKCANIALMKQGRAETILSEVIETVKRWPEFAAIAAVSPQWTTEIARHHRLSFARRSSTGTNNREKVRRDLRDRDR